MVVLAVQGCGMAARRGPWTVTFPLCLGSRASLPVRKCRLLPQGCREAVQQGGNRVGAIALLHRCSQAGRPALHALQALHCNDAMMQQGPLGLMAVKEGWRGVASARRGAAITGGPTARLGISAQPQSEGCRSRGSAWIDCIARVHTQTWTKGESATGPDVANLPCIAAARTPLERKGPRRVHP